jgi:hypothetical protein
MKFIVKESQINQLMINEGLLSFFTKQLPRAVKSVKPKFFSKPVSKNVTDELHRLIPKQYLTNPKEVSTLSKRLSDLGPDINTIKLNYIKKYGQGSYDELIRKYLYGSFDKKSLTSTLKSVKNVKIKLKPVMGQGADHQVFESITHPDKIFKLELRPGEIDKWYNTFVTNPNVFPKVFKKVKVKGKNGEILTSAVMERLNTTKFMNLWDEMEKLMHRSQKNLPISEQVSTLEYLTKNFKKNSSYSKQWNNFINYSKTSGGGSTQKIDEFIKMVNDLYKITPNPDIRKFNFGYDKQGVLKSLDL